MSLDPDEDALIRRETLDALNRAERAISKQRLKRAAKMSLAVLVLAAIVAALSAAVTIALLEC